jgi:hypothetical protein
MNDTPETDGAEIIFSPLEGDAWVPASISRKLERERDEAREKYDTLAVENMLEVNKLCKERDEAREQNAKLRDIAERAVERIEQENWGITEVADFWKQLRTELDRLKEGAKCPVCSPEQKCWECADDVSREGAK